MTGADMEARYRRDIIYLNDHRVDELGEFVHERLTYNGRPTTRPDYQELIAGNIAAIPDLFFDVHLLFVDGNRIACRLNFNCTPWGEILGLPPNGKSISFSEHAFYELRDGKIREGHRSAVGSLSTGAASGPCAPVGPNRAPARSSCRRLGPRDRTGPG